MVHYYITCITYDCRFYVQPDDCIINNSNGIINNG